MELGAFSISLTVKDLETSRRFYEGLGFRVIAGEPDNNWQILRNGLATIGIFQGKFDRNTLTFNPGWANQGDHPKTFSDVRDIQRRLKKQGYQLVHEADDSSTGPAALMLFDPDGNPILIDQHR